MKKEKKKKSEIQCLIDLTKKIKEEANETAITRFIPSILSLRNRFDLLITINIAREEKLPDKQSRKKKRGKTMGSKRALKNLQK